MVAFKTELGKTGLGIDLGALQYYYPGAHNTTLPKANTTELYGALTYGWLQAKLSGVVSNDAWGFGKKYGNPVTLEMAMKEVLITLN
jgi:hypothetical protein